VPTLNWLAATSGKAGAKQQVKRRWSTFWLLLTLLQVENAIQTARYLIHFTSAGPYTRHLRSSFPTMKIAKSLLPALFTSLFALVASGCNKCKDENPQARITNNGTQKASVQVKTSGGNTININNVDPGTSSAYASYAPGQVTFTIAVNNTSYVKTTDISTCYQYDIAIDRANAITVTAIDRND
jgi:hypothetical protein